MSVMKPYLMAISILLILVHKTPGDLLRSYFGRSQEPWNPCQLYHGMCRNACMKYEIQYLTCPNDQKCCLKFFAKIANSNHVKEDSNFNLSVTNT
ncbi:beta-defensin 116 [Pteropus alecto]|uniref:beta-defensin 116 n=1 Tax=Pteropus alecto TaxID=9402 RepID=UPI0007686F18|nr:beta-defensin 116 [Pteropus alecto]